MSHLFPQHSPHRAFPQGALKQVEHKVCKRFWFSWFFFSFFFFLKGVSTSVRGGETAVNTHTIPFQSRKASLLFAPSLLLFQWGPDSLPHTAPLALCLSHGNCWEPKTECSARHPLHAELCRIVMAVYSAKFIRHRWIVKNQFHPINSNFVMYVMPYFTVNNSGPPVLKFEGLLLCNN